MATTGNSTVATPPVVLPPGAKTEAPDPLARAYDIPCTLVLEIPVVNFSVGSLLQLRPGSLVVTAGQQNEDLPLQVNGQPVGMVEVDVVGNQLAVRLTGMA